MIEHGIGRASPSATHFPQFTTRIMGLATERTGCVCNVSASNESMKDSVWSHFGRFVNSTRKLLIFELNATSLFEQTLPPSPQTLRTASVYRRLPFLPLAPRLSSLPVRHLATEFWNV